MNRRILMLSGATVLGLVANGLIWSFGWRDLPPLTYHAADTLALASLPQSPTNDGVQSSFDPAFLGHRRAVQTSAPSHPPPSLRPVPRLLGLASESGVAIAILQSSSSEVLRVREGDAVEGWAIRTIGRRDVLIAGPQGEQRLHLDDR